MQDPPTCGEHSSHQAASECATASQPTPPSGSDAHAGGGPGAADAANHVHCWACHTKVAVPLVGESQQPAPMFKVAMHGEGPMLQHEMLFWWGHSLASV